ncbi:MAG: hypothetical protein WCI36_04775 [bacterium]
MNKNIFSKLVIIFSVLVFMALVAYAFFVFKKRNPKTIPTPPTEQVAQIEPLPIEQKNENNENPTDTSPSPMGNQSQPVNENPMGKPTTQEKTPPTISTTPTISGSTLAHVTAEHCNNGCQAFSIDLKLFEYCQQTCGISPIKNEASCEGKNDIQKDYCNKDLAITKKDISICEKIADANIKETCKNRITQDVIENL